MQVRYIVLALIVRLKICVGRRQRLRIAYDVLTHDFERDARQLLR